MVLSRDWDEDCRQCTETNEPCPGGLAIEVNKPDDGTKIRVQEFSFQNPWEKLKVGGPTGPLVSSVSERSQLHAVMAIQESSSTEIWWWEH